MHRITFITFVFCCLGLLSLASAQLCGPQNNNQVCSPPNCCSSSGFCGDGASHCGVGCQSAFGTCIVDPIIGPSTTATQPATSTTTDLASTTAITTAITTTTLITTTLTTTTLITTTLASTTTTTSSTRGTFQLQPTGAPNSVASSRDKSIESRLALVVVVLVGLLA